VLDVFGVSTPAYMQGSPLFGERKQAAAPPARPAVKQPV
jgi:hypothetical protein